MQIAIKHSIAAGALLALVLTLATGVAHGQGYAPDNERGWYVGGGVGQFGVEIDGLDGLDDTIADFDADDTAWKLFAGYRFNPYLSLEAAYVNFGEPGDDFSSGGSSGDYTLNLSGFAPYLVGTVPLGPLELFAKIGYYFYDLEIDADLDDLGGDVFTSSDSGQDMVYGVGVGITFMERFNARLEYENIDVEGTDDANAFWLTGAWRF